MDDKMTPVMETAEEITEVQERGSSLYDLFGTDKNLETAGIWLDYGKAGRIKIARAGGSNKRFATDFEQRMRPHRRKLELGTLDEDTANRILAEAFAHTVVLDLENVRGPDGAIIAYSPENVVQLFIDLPDLFADVREQAMKVANFAASSIEHDAGN